MLLLLSSSKARVFLCSVLWRSDKAFILLLVLPCQDFELLYFYFLFPEIALEHLAQLPECQSWLSFQNNVGINTGVFQSAVHKLKSRKNTSTVHQFQRFILVGHQNVIWKNSKMNYSQVRKLTNRSLWKFPVSLGFVCGIFSPSLIRFQEEFCDTSWLYFAEAPLRGK